VSSRFYCYCNLHFYWELTGRICYLTKQVYVHVQCFCLTKEILHAKKKQIYITCNLEKIKSYMKISIYKHKTLFKQCCLACLRLLLPYSQGLACLRLLLPYFQGLTCLRLLLPYFQGLACLRLLFPYFQVLACLRHFLPYFQKFACLRILLPYFQGLP
jgi:hypothetical protein